MDKRTEGTAEPCKPVGWPEFSLAILGDDTRCSPPKFASQFRLGSTPTQPLPDLLERVFLHIRFFKHPTKHEYGGRKRWSSLLISSSLFCVFPCSLPLELRDISFAQSCQMVPIRGSLYVLPLSNKRLPNHVP